MMAAVQRNSEFSFRVVDLVTTDEDQKFAPAGHMAAAIIKITQEQGDCQPEDLSANGFAADEVAAQWHMAQSLALVELRLMSKARMKPKILFRGF